MKKKDYNSVFNRRGCILLHLRSDRFVRSNVVHISHDHVGYHGSGRLNKYTLYYLEVNT